MARRPDEAVAVRRVAEAAVAVCDDGMVLLGDAEVPVTDLIAAILARVAREARQAVGAPPAAVALGSRGPARGTGHRRLLRSVCRVPRSGLVGR